MLNKKNIYRKTKDNALSWWKKKINENMIVDSFLTFQESNEFYDYKGSSLTFELNNSLSKKIMKICNNSQDAIFIFLLCGIQCLSYKYTNNNNLTLGIPKPPWKSNLGTTSNTVPLQTNILDSSSFVDILIQVKKSVLDIKKHRNIPYKEILRILDITSHDSKYFFKTVVILDNIHKYDYSNNFSDLLFRFNVQDNNITCTIKYNSLKIDNYKIIQLEKHLYTLLDKVTETPDVNINEFDILSEEEQKTILHTFNNVYKKYDINKTIMELFEEQVLKTPSAIALICENNTITYDQLNKTSNQFARYLKKIGVRNETTVSLILDKSINMIIAIFGILKAGGAYIPIYPDYPINRKQLMLKNSGSNFLVLDKPIQLDTFEGHKINIETSDFSHERDENLDINFDSSNLAYILYTSGSTGEPKGVMVEHKSVVNRLYWLKDKYNLRENDRILFRTPYIFDVSISEIFGWFLGGSQLVIFEDDSSIEYLLESIKKYNITYINFTPSLLNFIDSSKCEKYKDTLNSLKYICSAGEAFSREAYDLFTKHSIDIQFENLYGPTETTIYSTAYSLKGTETSRNIPIGKPISNTSTYILDKNNNLLPIGSVGELYIAGEGLARAYLNQPLITQERFVDNPFQPNTKMYKTGDLCRWTPDGNIEFLGRVDNQVKIRGVRIELKEIEHVLRSHENIDDAVVIPRDTMNSKLLYAYIVSSNNWESSELRDYLASILPKYMIPSYFIKIDKIPLTPNKKVDKKSLFKLDKIITTQEYISPSSHMEKTLTEMWKKVLNTDKDIGVLDNFFDIGGHSLLAMTLNSKIYEMFSIKCSTKDVFDHSTIRELAIFLESGISKDDFIINPVGNMDYYPVSSSQKRMYIMYKIHRDTINYNVPIINKIKCKIDISRLEKAFNQLISRHETLRTYFEIIDDKIIQKIKDTIDINIQYLSTSKGNIDRTIDNFIKLFDISKPPILRVGLLSISNDEHIIIIDTHHILIDGVSIKIILEDLFNLYEGTELPKLEFQYKDYAVWENTFQQSETMKKQEDYWLNKFSTKVDDLIIPYDFPSSNSALYIGEKICFDISTDFFSKINEFKQKTGTTLYMVLLSAYKILLAKCTGKKDIVIGSPIAGRTHPCFNNVVGVFINTLALRSYVDYSKTLRNFTEEVKIIALEAYENQNYPFEQLVEKLNIDRNVSKNPLFNTMFILQNTPQPDINIEGLQVEPYDYKSKSSIFDILLQAVEFNNSITFTFEYNSNLYSKDTIFNLINDYKKILFYLVSSDNLKIQDIVN